MGMDETEGQKPLIERLTARQAAFQAFLTEYNARMYAHAVQFDEATSGVAPFERFDAFNKVRLAAINPEAYEGLLHAHMRKVSLERFSMQVLDALPENVQRMQFDVLTSYVLDALDPKNEFPQEVSLEPIDTTNPLNLDERIGLAVVLAQSLKTLGELIQEPRENGIKKLLDFLTPKNGFLPYSLKRTDVERKKGYGDYVDSENHVAGAGLELSSVIERGNVRYLFKRIKGAPKWNQPYEKKPTRSLVIYGL